MVGEHSETGKFTTMAREGGHECHWTRPGREGEHGQITVNFLSFRDLSRQEKSLWIVALTAQLEGPKSLYQGPVGRLGVTLAPYFSFLRSSNDNLRSRALSTR